MFNIICLTMDTQTPVMNTDADTVVNIQQENVESPNIGFLCVDLPDTDDKGNTSDVSGLSGLKDIIAHFIHIGKPDIEMKKEMKKEQLTIITITIFHIIIGSYMGYHMGKIALSDKDKYKYKHNHEFPKFVRNMLESPLEQLTPSMIDLVKKFGKLVFRQVLILIDPQYKINKQCYGINSVISELLLSPDDISICHNIEFNDGDKLIIQSEVHPIIVPSNIEEEQVKELIEATQCHYANANVFMNCMSCTGGTTWNLYSQYITNTNPNQHITRPNCLIDDNDIILKLTYDITCGSIRWLSYKYDAHILPDLYKQKDTCMAIKITYDNIITLFDQQARRIDFVLIVKMLGLLTFTKNLPDGTKVIFADMTLQEFINIWYDPDNNILLCKKYTFNSDRHDKFIDYFTSHFGYEYSFVVINFVNILLSNNEILNAIAYENGTTLNKPMVEVLIDEYYRIVKEYNTYFPHNTIELEKGHFLSKSNQIRVTLQKYCDCI